jgi:hypothetical protein
MSVVSHHSDAPYNRVVPVRYHIQDDDCFCGAAAAMMILRSRGGPFHRQRELFKKIYNSDPGWSGKVPGSSPKGLSEGLQYFADPAWGLNFTARYFSCQDDVVRRLIELLYGNDAVAPAVLVYKCGHWLVVTGFQTDVEPIQGTNFHVLGFYVNSPLFRTANFAHSDDDICGTCNFGLQDEFLSLDAFLGLLTACRKPPAPFALVEATRGELVGTMLMRRHSVHRATAREEYGSLWTDSSFDATAVRNFALDALERYGLDASGFFPGSGVLGTEDPLLVQRLDLLDSYYALVPLVRDVGRVGYARLDMNDRSLLGACVTDADVVPAMSMEHVLLSETYDCAETIGTPRPGTYAAHPTLVWRPCRESTSPYAPFRQISAGGRVLFYGSDGVLRRFLTPLED